MDLWFRGSTCPGSQFKPAFRERELPAGAQRGEDHQGTAPSDPSAPKQSPQGKERVTARGPVKCAHSIPGKLHTTPRPGYLKPRPPHKHGLKWGREVPGARDSSSRISPRIARNNRSRGGPATNSARRSPPTGHVLDCNWFAEPFADSEKLIRWHAWLKPRNKHTILAGSTRYR